MNRAEEQTIKSLNAWILFVSALSITLLACSAPHSKQLDLAEVRKSIEAQNAKWLEAMKINDIPTLISIYSDDVTVLPPNKPMLRGKEQLKASFGLMPAKGRTITKAALNTLDIQGKDSTVLEIGQYLIDIVRPNMPAYSDSGKYSTVWKLQTDGTWKIYADCWNSSKPLQVNQK